MSWLYIFIIVMYLAATASISTRLFHQQGPQHKLAGIFAIVALVAHAFLLNQRILTEPGQDMSITNVASLIAWLITCSMTFASFSLASALLLPMVYGFSAMVILIQWLLPTHHVMYVQMEPALISHITIALLAYGCLVIAFLYALQLSYINYRLKHRQASLLHSSLPPLMRVESVLFKLLLIGTIMLSLSLISGFFFLDNMLKSQIHKTVLSCIAWVLYVTVLIGHHKFGWRGKPVVASTIAGAMLLTLAYFGSRFVKEVILGRF
ncbi:cytochrome C assembly family protein [Neptunicella marina]|uniref:Cytochrome c biogenesis protein CcsA n=1 Tax=Neptunicella marina TaxID=2125989 RepID=A0A8J6LZN5_9ALTE|nr:cytochrome c biogenesis protein CcsA [Neptunicella marina]MBC3766719.1 cytochrome c biogenesis protein CcsA [Neptunicella marina]